MYGATIIILQNEHWFVLENSHKSKLYAPKELFKYVLLCKCSEVKGIREEKKNPKKEM